MYKDVWQGKFILLWPEGDPVGVDALSIYRPIHPVNVIYFESKEDAERFSQDYVEEQLSVHKVERLQILEEGI